MMVNPLVESPAEIGVAQMDDVAGRAIVVVVVVVIVFGSLNWIYVSKRETRHKKMIDG